VLWRRWLDDREAVQPVSTKSSLVVNIDHVSNMIPPVTINFDVYS